MTKCSAGNMLYGFLVSDPFAVHHFMYLPISALLIGHDIDSYRASI